MPPDTNPAFGVWNVNGIGTNTPLSRASFTDFDTLHLAVIADEQLAIGKGYWSPVLSCASDLCGDTFAVCSCFSE